jgi:hypothetical protein
MSREAYSDIACGLIIKELSSWFLKILTDSASDNKYCKTVTQTTSLLIHKLSVVEKFFWYVV